MSAHLQAALAYARRGWRVVPSWHVLPDGSCACPAGRGKLPPNGCDKQGKHPRLRDWTRVATTDESSLCEWWEQWPEANVSIVTGRESGIFVVDVDPRHGGDASVEEYESNTQRGMPATLTASTGGGGRHLFYRYPDWLTDDDQLGNVVDFLPGVDIRGEGGQVVAPPSPHVSGHFYTWASGWEEGPADPPDELVQMVMTRAGRGTGLGSGGAANLPSAAEILSGVPEGERNDTLFRWACQLRRQLRDDRSAVEVLVRQAAATCGVGDAEVSTILESAWRQDHTDPMAEMNARAAEALSRRHEAERLVGTGLDPSNDESGRESVPLEWNPGEPYPTTDYGNALRFVAKWGDDFRWVKRRGGFWTWDGRRWVPDDLDRAGRFASEVWWLVAQEAETTDDTNRESDLRRWTVSSQSAGKISAVPRIAAPMVAAGEDVFDSDPWLLNVSNGCVDLRTMRVGPHDRRAMLTKLAAATYQADAEAPLWEAFVEKVLPDPAVRWYVQKALGYSLTGVVDAKAMFVCQGSGDNGKSVFLETLRECVFGDYAAAAGKDVIMVQRNPSHETGVASLAGARFVTIAEEVGPSDRLNLTLLKSMTGGDLLKARFMKQDHFEFKPQLKLWIGTNHKPGLLQFDRAVRRRLRLIPFTYSFGPDEARDASEVKAEFAAEGPGILNWVLAGLRGYLTERLEAPSSVMDEVDEWMEEDDAVGQFLSERCEPVSLEEGATLSELHAAYSTWAAVGGEPTIGKKTFRRDLEAKPVEVTKSRSTQAKRYAVRPRPVNQYGL